MQNLSFSFFKQSGHPHKDGYHYEAASESAPLHLGPPLSRTSDSMGKKTKVASSGPVQAPKTSHKAAKVHTASAQLQRYLDDADFDPRALHVPGAKAVYETAKATHKRDMERIMQDTQLMDGIDVELSG